MPNFKLVVPEEAAKPQTEVLVERQADSLTSFWTTKAPITSLWSGKHLKIKSEHKRLTQTAKTVNSEEPPIQEETAATTDQTKEASALFRESSDWELIQIIKSDR